MNLGGVDDILCTLLKASVLTSSTENPCIPIHDLMFQRPNSPEDRIYFLEKQISSECGCSVTGRLREAVVNLRTSWAVLQVSG